MRRSIILLVVLLAIIPGCVRTVAVEITGDGQRVYFSCFTKKVEPYDSLKSRRSDPSRTDYMNRRIEKMPGDDLAKNATVQDLPIRVSESLDSDENLHLYCKPFAATGDIIIRIYKDGKLARTRTLKPGDMGIYLNL